MKKIVTLSLAFILIICNLVSCSVLENYLDKKVEPVIEDEYKKDRDEDETDSSIISSCIGYWHPMSDEGEIELRIHEVENDYVLFSLWYKDKIEVENIIASVLQNKASFGMNESADTISGELIFEDSYIKLRIDDTNVSYIDIGVTVFDGRHDVLYKDSPVTEDNQPNQSPDGVVPPAREVQPFAKRVYTGGSVLNLRTGPDVNYPSLYKMPDDAIVHVHGYSSDGQWVYVYFSEHNLYGWCSDEWLKYVY